MFGCGEKSYVFVPHRFIFECHMNQHVLCYQFVVVLFIYLGFYIAFNTVQVISRGVVGMVEETSTYSWSGFCTVNCWPTASNYQLSRLRPCREPNPGLRGGRRECCGGALGGRFLPFNKIE